MIIRKTNRWFVLPSFYKYTAIADVRMWDIHWLCFVIIRESKGVK